MEETPYFMALQDQVQTALIATTKTAGQVSSEDLPFQRSLHPEVGTAIDEQNTRLLGIVSELLKSAASVSELRAPEILDTEDLETEWSGIVDIFDSLLEKADTCLDEYTGVIKRRDTSSIDQVSASMVDVMPLKCSDYN